MEEEKTYFTPGMIVTLRLDIPNKPIMLVIKKESLMFKSNSKDEGTFRGIKCRWFTTTGQLLEAVFNTKDIILIKL